MGKINIKNILIIAFLFSFAFLPLCVEATSVNDSISSIIIRNPNYHFTDYDDDDYTDYNTDYNGYGYIYSFYGNDFYNEYLRRQREQVKDNYKPNNNYCPNRVSNSLDFSTFGDEHYNSNTENCGDATDQSKVDGWGRVPGNLRMGTAGYAPGEGSTAFNGNHYDAIYVYLVKYNYDTDYTRGETIVGTPYIYYNDSFLQTESSNPSASRNATSGGGSSGGGGGGGGGGGTGYVTEHGGQIAEGINKDPELKDPSTAKDIQKMIIADADSQNSGGGGRCVISPFSVNYGSEVINEYPPENVVYRLNGGDVHVPESHKIKTNDLSANTIKYNIIPNIIGQGSSSTKVNNLNSKFMLTGADRITLEHSEDYYIAVKGVQRSVSTSCSLTGGYDTKSSGGVRESPGGINYIYTYSCSKGTLIGDSTVTVQEGATPPTCNNCCEVIDYWNCTKTYYDQNGEERNIDYRSSQDESDADCTPHKVYEDAKPSYSSCTGYRLFVEKTLHTDVYTCTSYVDFGGHVAFPTTIKDPGARHELTDKDGNTIIEFYKGSDLDRALVGDGSVSGGVKNTFYYNFADANHGIAGKPVASQTYYHWVLSDEPSAISCKSECPNSNDLNCYETYCDNFIGYDNRTDVYNRKKDCIVNLCGYKKKVDDCSTSNDYNNILNNLNNDCSQYNDTSICNRKSNGDDDNDKVTGLWCYNDSKSTPVDQKTFLNTYCVEKSHFSFYDVSKEKLSSGKGIDYYSKLHGKKDCKVWFDLDSWQLSYASFHSRDDDELLCIEFDFENDKCTKTIKQSSRELMLEILKKYNNSASTYKVSPLVNSISTLSDGDHSSDPISWENLDYIADSSRINSSVKIVEKEGGKVFHEETKSLIPLDNDSTGSTKVMYENKEPSVRTAYSRYYDQVVKANYFMTNSYLEKSYVFPKACVSTDGKGSVSQLGYNADDTCYLLGNEKVSAQNKLYTTFRPPNSSEEYEISLQTKSEILEDRNIPSNIYERRSSCNNLVENDICSVKEENRDYDKAYCKIIIEPNANTKLENGVYYGGVKATLKAYNNNTEIYAYKIENNKNASQISIDSSSKEKNISINVNPTSTITNNVSIAGALLTNKGVVTCDETIKIVEPPPYVPCVISKISESGDSSCDSSRSVNYKVTWTSNPGNAYYSTSSDIRRSEIGKNDRGEYIISIGQSYVSQDGLTLKVDGNNSYCTYNITPCVSLNNGNHSCPRDINPNGDVERAEIVKYCEKYALVDINGYDGVDDCINKCWSRSSASCRDKCSFVIGNCLDDEAKSKVGDCCDCMAGGDSVKKAQCEFKYYYESCPPDHGEDFVFRSISNYEPFPNSNGSIFSSVERKIGINWRSEEAQKFITSDDEDSTSVTGVNAFQSAEYVIELTPSDIKKIRDDTQKVNGASKGDIYTIYDYSSSVNTEVDGVDKASEYKSAFVHDKFSELFKVVPNK